MKLATLLLTALMVPAILTAQDAYTQSILDWRKQRMQRLKAPDSWLSLIGLHWLERGDNTVGAAYDNTLRLESGPQHFGTVTLAPGGVVTYTPNPSAYALVDNLPAKVTDLNYLPGLKQTVVSGGTVSFFVIQRGSKIGLRVRDINSPRRLRFAGIESYPIDPAWRIEADWVAFPKPQPIKVTNMIGQTVDATAPGKAVFTYQGHTVELLPIDEGTRELFFVITDPTAGEETYEACRFVYAEPPVNGKIVLDFNRAENPPCAFTPFATCPLPPASNRLPFPVRAGEKKYAGEHH